MSNLILLERIYQGHRGALKRTILNEALFCFLNQGIEATNIEMIRARAETSVGAIYHHFQHKEGIVQALYLVALEDQAQRREQVLQQAKTLQQGIEAIISSYIDWVVEFPDFARFLYMASFSVRQYDDKMVLNSKNSQRNQNFMQWIKQCEQIEIIENIPPELLLSLVIGTTESYCRAWLSQKVKTSPEQYKNILARSAWRTLADFNKTE